MGLVERGGGAGLRSTRVEYTVSLLVSTLSEQTMLACLFPIALLDKSNMSSIVVLKVSTQKSTIVYNKA